MISDSPFHLLRLIWLQTSAVEGIEYIGNQRDRRDDRGQYIDEGNCILFQHRRISQGFLLRHPRRLLHILPLPWVSLKYVLRRIANADLKQHFLHAVLCGASQHEVENSTSIFVDRSFC